MPQNSKATRKQSKVPRMSCQQKWKFSFICFLSGCIVELSGTEVIWGSQIWAVLNCISRAGPLPHGKSYLWSRKLQPFLRAASMARLHILMCFSEPYKLPVGSYSTGYGKFLKDMVGHTVPPGKLLPGGGMGPVGTSRKCSLMMNWFEAQWLLFLNLKSV